MTQAAYCRSTSPPLDSIIGGSMDKGTSLFPRPRAYVRDDESYFPTELVEECTSLVLEKMRKSKSKKKPNERTFCSMDEIHAAFFPNNFLYDLESKLCDHLGMTEPHQHECRPNKEDPLTGSIEVARPAWFGFNDPFKVAQEHYQERGYEVKQVRFDEKGYAARTSWHAYGDTRKRKEELRSQDKRPQGSFIAAKDGKEYSISMNTSETSYSFWITTNPFMAFKGISEDVKKKHAMRQKKQAPQKKRAKDA